MSGRRWLIDFLLTPADVDQESVLAREFLGLTHWVAAGDDQDNDSEVCTSGNGRVFAS